MRVSGLVRALFDRQPLPDDLARVLAAEALRGEATVTRLRLGFAVVGILAVFLNWGANTPEASIAAVACGAAYGAYAALVLGVLARGRHPVWVRFVSVAVDMLVVTLASASGLANHTGGYEALLAPIFPLLYTLWIGLTGLQYSVPLSLFAAGSAAFLRLGLVAFVVGTGRVEVSDTAVYGERAVGLADQVTLVLFLALTGVVAAWVAATSRTVLLQSARETLRKQALEREQAHYRKYMSGNVLDYVLSNPETMGLGGTRRVASVLFLDIRGFTAYTEGQSPERVVEDLNAWFTEFVAEVFEHGGTLDKFLGDGLMAVFGVPREMPDAPVRAVRAALGILERLERINARRPEGAPELRIGVGIAHGVVIAGNIGSEDRMEFTVVGDTVNFAARLQELTKDLNTTLVVSEPVYDAVRGELPFRRLPSVKVRGKSGEIPLYGYVAPAATSEAPEPSRPFALHTRAGGA